MVIYTIGHSNQAGDTFIKLLEKHGIEVVADVRSKPYSRFCPQFNRDALKNLLQNSGIDYLFFGRELGGKPRDLDRPLAEELVQEHLRSRPQFREGLGRLLAEARTARVCIVCAEADPARCHRSQLLAPELEAQGVEVRHILADGSLLNNRDLLLPKHAGQKRLF